MSTLTVKQMKIRFYPITVNAAILPNSKYYRRFLNRTIVYTDIEVLECTNNWESFSGSGACDC